MTLEITSYQIIEAIEDYLGKVLNAKVTIPQGIQFVSKTPPELYARMMDVSARRAVVRHSNSGDFSIEIDDYESTIFIPLAPEEETPDGSLP